MSCRTRALARQGATKVNVTWAGSITTLPASGNVTVMRPPLLDWTCPRPQSGLSGWRTRVPGENRAERPDINPIMKEAA
jgi:hypothetical protein